MIQHKNHAITRGWGGVFELDKLIISLLSAMLYFFHKYSFQFLILSFLSTKSDPKLDLVGHINLEVKERSEAKHQKFKVINDAERSEAENLFKGH